MSNNIHISTIVPVYNAEKYIDRCLESLLNQSICKNIEIIVINDGSTDSTPKIINRYSETFDNIKVLHTTNQGVSAARNLGIQQARGEYITFIDADDWLEPKCYEKMYTNAKLYNADIVASGLYIDTNDRRIISRKVVSQNTVADGKEAIRKYLYGDLDVHVFNKIFISDIVKRHVFDTKLQIAEDRLFLFECLLDAQRVFLAKDCFYHYFQNRSSVMNQPFSTKNLDNITVGKKIIKKVEENCPELLPYALAMYVKMECRLYGEMTAEKITRKYYKEYKVLKQDIKDFHILKNLPYISKKHIYALILVKINPHIYNYLRNNPALKFRR